MKLTDDLKYDEKLTFDEQDAEVKAFIENAISREPDEKLDIAPEDNRPEQYIWYCDGFTVKHHYTFPYPFPCQNQRVLETVEAVKN